LDATPEDYAADLAIALQDAGAGQVLALSSVTGSGVTTMLRQLINVIETSRAKEAEPEEAVPWSP
jgi:tRNA A37 threonylcarbamoyladenosine biosynthesis protein TsaE